MKEKNSNTLDNEEQLLDMFCECIVRILDARECSDVICQVTAIQFRYALKHLIPIYASIKSVYKKADLPDKTVDKKAVKELFTKVFNADFSAYLVSKMKEDGERIAEPSGSMYG